MAERKRWTPEEDLQLVSLKKEGRTSLEIADMLGRTETAVNLRMVDLMRRARLAKNMGEKASVEDVEVPVEEYSEEEMRAATIGNDTPQKELRAVSLPVVHMAKEPCRVQSNSRLLRSAKTIRDTVKDIIGYASVDGDTRKETLIALGTLLADSCRLVEDLDERGE